MSVPTRPKFVSFYRHGTLGQGPVEYGVHVNPPKGIMKFLPNFASITRALLLLVMHSVQHSTGTTGTKVNAALIDLPRMVVAYLRTPGAFKGFLQDIRRS